MTALVDPANFGGHSLVYLPRYLTQSDDVWQKSDPEILEIFIGGLQRMYPSLARGDIVASQVARVREMLAVSTLHYTEQLSASTAHLTSEPLPGQFGPDSKRHPECQRDRGAGKCKCRRAESFAGHRILRSMANLS